MYTELDGSGYIHLSRYTTLIPTLGPCGFSRDQDMYDISTPRTQGRIEATELHISKVEFAAAKKQYEGYIEFIDNDTVDVELFEIIKGKKVKLKIKGKNRLKVEPNTIGGKRI